MNEWYQGLLTIYAALLIVFIGHMFYQFSWAKKHPNPRVWLGVYWWMCMSMAILVGGFFFEEVVQHLSSVNTGVLFILATVLVTRLVTGTRAIERKCESERYNELVILIDSVQWMSYGLMFFGTGGLIL